MKKKPPLFSLGILISSPFDHLPPNTKSFFADITQEAHRSHIAVCVITLADIHVHQDYVRGYSFHVKKQCWQAQETLWPHMIYDRFFGENAQQIKKYRMITRDLQIGKNIHWLNAKGRNKWEMDQCLRHESHLLPHLPATERYTSTHQLHRWLDDYQQVVIKPIHKSQGKGVLGLQYNTKQSGYVCTGCDPSHQPVHRHFATRDALMRYLSTQVTLGHTLLQQYLPLYNRKQCVYDVRVWVQKNKWGQFDVLGSFVREGKPGALTSNLHTGGRVYEANLYLNQQFGSNQVREICHTIHTIAQDIANCFERNFGRYLELAVDFGIDPDAHLWIIEVNSKPGRQAFYHLANQPFYETSIQQLIDYAIYVWRHATRSPRSFPVFHSLGG